MGGTGVKRKLLLANPMILEIPLNACLQTP